VEKNNPLFIFSFKQMGSSGKYIVSRIALAALLIIAVGLIYQWIFWPMDLKQHDAEVLPEILRKPDSCDVLYFAESSNATYADTDSNRMSISELTAMHFPGQVWGAINKGAAHAGVFVPLIKLIPENSRVKTIIVTMNLRSFDAAWIYSKYEASLMKGCVMYNKRPPLLNKLLINFGYYDDRTEQQRDSLRNYHWRYDTLHFPFEYPYVTVKAWDSTFGWGYYKNADSSWDIPKISLACHNIKAYAFQIDTATNPRIGDFDEIVRIAKQKNLKLIFHLLPENLEYADSLVGPALTFLMKQNRDLLITRYNKDGVKVVDNMELLPGKQYMDQDWTTEHYFYEGRKRIADTLATHIKVF
jgi:hypothetical protein